MTSGKDREGGRPSAPSDADALSEAGVPSDALAPSDADAPSGGDAPSDAEMAADGQGEDEAMRRLLKRALPLPPARSEKDFLRGVQARIRTRSRGKFFADGWSTSNSGVSYGAIAFAMLLVLLLVYVLLTPRSFTGP